MAGRTQRELAAEIGVLRRLRPNLTKAVSHLILSHDPTQRELTETEWKEAIQIALNEHGAGDAAMASWIHHDTDVRHCHLIFCRILPSGEVVSDSHNYRKNEAAARLIERTFMLDAPTPTPAEDRPGDRQALDSASRRADRRGTPGPEKISVQAVREALGKATTTEDYVRLNREIGNEIEYLRRGTNQEIYGCKIRRIGSSEWIKMSTLAKDLSWPKIAHRFVDSPMMAPAPTVEAPAAPVPATSKYDRAPASIRQTLLRPPPAQHQLAAVVPQKVEPEPGKKWGIDLQKVDALNLGPLSQSMLLLGAAAINCSISVIRMIVEFLKRLLARFGFGMTPVQQVANAQAAPAQVAFEPYVLEAQTREVVGQAQVDEAAAQVYRLAEAVRSKDTFLLPRGEGREVLAAAISADTGAVPAPTADSSVPLMAEPDALDDMFKLEVADAVTPAPEAPAAAPAVPAKSAWLVFQEAAKAFSLAAAAVQQASLKDIMYIDGRPKARALHQSAAAELVEREKANARWKSQNKIKASLGADPLGLKDRAEAARARVERAQAGVAKAEKEHRDFEVLFDKTPAPVVPMALQDRRAAAATDLNKAQQLLISKARMNLNILDGNPMLRQRREALAAQVRRAETRLVAFIADPRTQPKAVAELDQTLRELAAEVSVEQARLAPRPDIEDGQNADEAGQHGHAVPGR